MMMVQVHIVQYAIEHALHVMVEQIIVVWHAKVIVQFREPNVSAILVLYFN
jgi:hypothetical protein